MTCIKRASELSADAPPADAVIQAAEQGAGVALGLEPFIIEREGLGAICRPLSFAHPTGSYWPVHPPAAQRNRALWMFKRRLLAELASPHDRSVQSNIG